MVQSTTVDIKFFRSGYCTGPAFVVDPERGKGKRRFYAVWVLIKHPAHGYLLLDTGYSKRFFEVTRKFPEKFYALVTPVKLEEHDSALQQLDRLGIKASEINCIILSHFHADHIAGVKDFPGATFICSRKAMEELRNVNGFSAVKKGILKKLLPLDLESRTRFIEDIAKPETDNGSDLVFYDLYKDGSMQLFELPGHARGMLGLKVRAVKETIFFATDASWSRDTFLRQVLPSSLAKLFFDDWNEYKATLHKLFLFQKQNPETKILFTHCPETLNYISIP